MFGGVASSTEDLVTEVAYRWRKRFKEHGAKKVLPELQAEIQRMSMTPEAIVKFNREQLHE